jgi:type II secretory ATPase GspE/PulE/Tfp pilus assembly ATPase PilB-like protein
MEIEPFLIGSTLHTSVAQRLVRRICNYCKEEIKIPEKVRQDIEHELSHLDSEYIKSVFKEYDSGNIKIYEGKGCPRCGNSGFKGRLAIVEVLDINYDLAQKIKEGKKFLSLEEISETQQFVTSRQDGILKVIQGLTSYSEVLRVMKD